MILNIFLIFFFFVLRMYVIYAIYDARFCSDLAPFEPLVRVCFGDE
jgi:hypothetical protein